MVSAGPESWPVFEDAPDGMIVYEVETGAILDVNARFCELSRYTREQLRTMDVEAVTADGEQLPVSTDSFEGRATATWTVERAPGSPIELTVRVTDITTDDGTRLLGTVRSQEAIEDAAVGQPERIDRYKRYLDDILEAIGDVFYVVGSDGRLQRWNRALNDATGYTDEEIREMDATELFPESQRTAVGNTITEAFETGHVRVEQEMRTREGETIPYEFVGSRIETPAGEEVIAGIGRDITDRKRIERQLRRERDDLRGTNQQRKRELERYEQILNAVPDVVYAVDGRGNLTVANGRFVSLTDASYEDLVGESLADLRADDRVPDGLVPDREPEMDSKFETRLGDADRILEHHVVALSFPGRECGPGFVDIARDVTQRKEREEKLQQIRENVTDVVWIFDPQKGETEFVSDSYEDVWGRPPETLIDDSPSFVETVHPDDRDRVEAAQADQRENPDDYEETYQIVRPDGEVRWIHDQSAGVYEDGTLTRVVGIASDITKRKERERELQWFRQAVENAGHAIFIANGEGQIGYVNSAFEDQTGYAESEALGRDISTLGLDGDDETMTAEIWETLDRGEQWKGELVSRRRSGERYSVEQTLAPVLDEQGDLERIVGVVTDITEYRQRQQQFEVLQRLLRHDLRNNMNTVLMNARPLAMESDDDQVRERCQMITDVAQETIELSNKVKRAATALQAEGVTTVPVDISAEIHDEVEKLRNEYNAADITVDIDDGLDVLANDLIDRAVRNVMQNAIEHNDLDTPAVTVRTEHDDAEVAVHIADDGPGIAPEQIDALEAGDPARLDEFEGIGLWLVNWIVTSSGGDLSFADNDPRGTVVTLTLPRPTAGQS